MIHILPQDDKHGYRWSFCYLHGKAEDIMDQRGAPDIFTATEAMPDEPGSYYCTINGRHAVAVIAMHYERLGGRVALVSDIEALKHVLTPEDWC